MSNYPILIPISVEGEKGKEVYFETKRILERLFDIDLSWIQQECNKVADSYRDKWQTKDQNAGMIEEGLTNIPYKAGIRELHPPFLLTAPLTVRIKILDSRITIIDPSKSPDVSSAVDPQDTQNPVLFVFLSTLEVNGQIIRWTNYRQTVQQVIIHEFLHLCGDVKTPTREIVDGVIRHTRVGTEAIEPLILTK